MIETLPLAIGIGLVVSLLLSELLGVASAGMVVPGYLALYLDSPVHWIGTLLASVLTYAAVRTVGSVVILYGRRRTAAAILLGYLVGAGFAALTRTFIPSPVDPSAHVVIGFIIPGLIAIWMDRQGVVETCSSLTICAVLVRLVLLLVLGAEMPHAELTW